ncbi:MAG: methylated-DNA--[protein]-cysteine S-methyltransferase [Deltaproteobacteria bacterium]|jgi:methylated-DNA-[protein]-cysteine S-methyltransferase|nr:methylated-DNA--[protein]-cysteine S-methyltransferase [Deltaproteobacteria bacterium]
MLEIAYAEVETPMGMIGVMADPYVVRRIYFVQSSADLKRSLVHDYPDWQNLHQNDLTNQSVAQLNEFFSAQRSVFTLPLSTESFSWFARRVYSALANVPYGQVITYGALARLAGSPGAARAVGTIMAKNPFPVVVPCHRVVRGNGQLGNYSGGFGAVTKQHLIELESRHASRFAGDSAGYSA